MIWLVLEEGFDITQEIPDFDDIYGIELFIDEAKTKECMNIESGAEQNILLVEDNEGDILLFKEVFKLRNSPCTLSVVNDGEEAIKFLNKQDLYQDEVTPDLVLLDINMPKFTGLEVLENIKQNDKLQDIPILMLTSSRATNEISKARELGANGFLVKGLDFKLHDLITISYAAKQDMETWIEITDLSVST